MVQSALERLLADAETGYVPGPPAGSDDRLRELERRLRSEARQSFEEGYVTGLELADVREWWALERLAAADWRLESLTRTAGASAAVLDELRGRLAESERPAARRLAEELDSAAGDVRRVATFAGGLLAALRDCAVDVPLPYQA